MWSLVKLGRAARAEHRERTLDPAGVTLISRVVAATVGSWWQTAGRCRPLNVALDSTVGSLFGRDRECERVRSVLLAAANGNRQVAVISGELGVGKTTLVTQVLQSVDVHTLVGHCLPVEGEAMPFAPVMASLRDLLRELTPDASAELVRQWPPAFVDFLPFEYVDHDDQSRQTTEENELSSSGQARLFEWLLTLVVRLSTERPVAWLIEDVQWADKSTLDLISFLARNLRTERVAIILTLRTDELDRDHPVRRWLVELGRMAEVTRIPLQRLTRDATHAQLAELMSSDDLRRRRTLTDLIFEHSQGNPYFSEQLVSGPRRHRPVAREPLRPGRHEARGSSRHDALGPRRGRRRRPDLLSRPPRDRAGPRRPLRGGRPRAGHRATAGTAPSGCGLLVRQAPHPRGARGGPPSGPKASAARGDGSSQVVSAVAGNRRAVRSRRRDRPTLGRSPGRGQGIRSRRAGRPVG